MAKVNITFFMGNKVLNIFSSDGFFEESNILCENGEKILGRRDHFLGEGGHLTPKINITFLIKNYILGKYLHVE